MRALLEGIAIWQLHHIQYTQCLLSPSMCEEMSARSELHCSESILPCNSPKSTCRKSAQDFKKTANDLRTSDWILPLCQIIMLHVADHDELLPETNECFVRRRGRSHSPECIQSYPVSTHRRCTESVKTKRSDMRPLKMDLSLAWREQWLNLMFVSLWNPSWESFLLTNQALCDPQTKRIDFNRKKYCKRAGADTAR